MANPDHLKILSKGVKVWNQWREREPFVQPNLGGSDLSRIDLAGANLRNVMLKNVNLRNAKLRYASVIGTDLSYSDLTGANLHGTILRRADLHGAKLEGAILRRANLHGAKLNGADLSKAILTGADFCGADLSSADFRESEFGYSVLGNTDLSEAKGLLRVLHQGPSTVGIDTLYRSGGKIPEEFLRGAGVPEDVITYLLPLILKGPTIQWYSCFISHSTRDKDFAGLLCARLKAKNVRVYYAPDDLEGGDKLLDQLERAIQLHDRLLLVLSDHSILSEWVMTEIRRAREAERKEGRRKLFPIRLTDFRTLEEWKCPDSKSGQDLAEEVRQYFIPDFSNWRNHDDFEKSFERLLRDLKAEEAGLPVQASRR